MANLEQPIGKRFESDLKLIRESRKLSVEDISRLTLITPDVIMQFEDTGLINHPRFNAVYLKALVRTYADALNIPTDLAVQGLEEAMQGQYSGVLSQFIGQIASKPIPPAVKAPKERKNVTPPPEEPVAPAPSIIPAKAPEAKGEPETISDKKQRFVSARATSAPPKESLAKEETASESPKPTEKTLTKPALDKVEAIQPAEAVITNREDSEAVEMPTEERIRKTIVFDDTASGRTTAARPVERLNTERKFNSRMVVLPLIIVVVASVFGWFIYNEMNKAKTDLVQQDTPPANEPPATPNNATPASPVAPAPASTSSALPDTFNVVLASVGGAVQGARITVETEDRFPMWIEASDTLWVNKKAKQPRTLRAVNQIVLDKGPFKNLRLLIAGKALAIPGADTVKQVTLTRAQIQQLLSQ